MSDCAIRVATPGDAAGVSALLATAYPVLMEPAYDNALLGPALDHLARANPALLASGQYYVAQTADGLVIGCGGWTMQRPGDGTVEPGVGHVRHFATHPHWTNRGIGRAIYLLCESAARSLGVERLECYSSRNAEGFYAALGFERVCGVELALGPNVGLPAVLMRRPIEGPRAWRSGTDNPRYGARSTIPRINKALQQPRA